MGRSDFQPLSGEPDWRLIAESIPHIVWTCGADGLISSLNRRGTEYTGLPAEAGPVAWSAVVHPDEVDGVLEAWGRALATGSNYEVEYRMRRVDGEYRWHAVRALPVRGPDGAIVRWIGTATDIQDHKTDQLGLADAYAQAVEAATLIAAFEAAAPLGFVYVDLEERISRINHEFAGIVGTPRREQVGRLIAELVPALWAQIEPAYAKVVAEETAVRNASMVGSTAEDPGRFHEWLVSCFPVHHGAELSGVGVVAVDVTERVQAEEFRSAVMSQVADGVYTQDPHGRLTSMNRAACRMLGWTEEELQGESIHEVIHFQNADRTRVPESECSLVTSGTQGRLSRAVGEAFTRKDGSIFPVAFSSVPLRVGSKTEGVAVVFRDISEPGTSPNVIRLLIVDNHAMTSEAFELLLSRQEGVEVVGSASTSAAALSEVTRLTPDVVLIDYALPDRDGVATTRLIKGAFPGVSVILMNESYDEALVADAVEAGCAGVLDKDRAWVELVGAVRAAYHGQTTLTQTDLQRLLPRLAEGRPESRVTYLTDREREVLALLTQGHTTDSIAGELSITPNTARNHIQRILYKLNVHSRLEAVVVAAEEASK
jgi:PAS domain S-box-containing protein